MRSTLTSCTAAPYSAKPLQNLTLVERERITDVLKIQSVRNSLGQVDEEKIPSKEEIEHCLESAHHDLRAALGHAAMRPPCPRRKGQIKTLRGKEVLPVRPAWHMRKRWKLSPSGRSSQI
jgi:hypothetical protein